MDKFIGFFLDGAGIDVPGCRSAYKKSLSSPKMSDTLQ